jgi:hypothetical protein
MTALTAMTAPSAIAEGLRLLADILDTTAIPAPYRIGYSVLASTDAEGTAAIDRIGLALDQAGIPHRVEDTDQDRLIVISLAEHLEYEICYVFKAAMVAARRRASYYDNIA